MGVILELVQPELEVDPGGEASVELRVTNDGTVVDQIDLTPLGTPAEWMQIDPPRLNLLPGQRGSARVQFTPPRSWTVRAGEHPYAVKAASREGSDDTLTEEGVVTVHAFESITAELVPGSARQPRAGHHDLAVDNLGNEYVAVNLAASDPDENLEFRWARSELEIEPGTTTFVHLRARPTTRFIRGADKSMPFTIVVRTDSGEMTSSSGLVRQRAIVSPGLARLAVLFLALAVLWFAFLQPRLDRVDAAVEANANETAQVLAPAQKQLNDAPAAQQQRAAVITADRRGKPAPTPQPTTAAQAAAAAAGLVGPAGPPGPPGAPGPGANLNPAPLQAVQTPGLFRLTSTRADVPGLALTLPAAGTYSLDADVRAIMNYKTAGQVHNCYIVANLAAAGVMIPNSERIVLVDLSADRPYNNEYLQNTVPIRLIYQVSAPTTVTVQARAVSSSSSCPTDTGILANENGRSTLAAVRIQ